MSANTHASNCVCEACYAGPKPRVPPARSEEALQSQSEAITLTRAELQEERDAAFRMGVKAGMEKRDLRPIEGGKAR